MKNSLPDTITINGQIVSMYDFMLTPCESKEDLHNWIKIFLGLDMPDCTVCEESSSSPMDMIWNIYRAAKDGDPIESSQLYFASRDSFKTLSAAICELLSMLHLRRTCSHMGAIKQQAKKCYDYVKNFLRRDVLNKVPQLRDTMERTELGIPSNWDMNPYLQIIVCTMAGANSEHTHLLCVDEVDVVKDIQAYREAKKIPTETPDKKPSITLYISTRKSSFGLVQREVDDAQKSGLQVRSWNIIDVAQACPKEKNQMDKGTVDLYFKQNQLELIDEIQYKELSLINQSEYEKRTMYPGCVGCPIAPLCLGRLATKQKSNSRLLKSHADVEKKFRESETDDAIAQLMCAKPSTHGLVFTQFNPLRSVVSATKMWEIFMGKKADREISLDELIDTFQKYGIPAFAGIDFGWDSPSVCQIMYIDKRENVYIVGELAVRHTDDPEFISLINRKIHPKYKIAMYYPDTANPSGVNLLKKAGLPVYSKVNKDIHLGIQTMKRFIKVPGLGITKLFVLRDACSGLLDEIGKFHLKLDASGQIISHDEYADEFDHHIDATRYVIKSRLSRIGALMGSVEIPKQMRTPLYNSQDGTFNRLPTPEELARYVGDSKFRDNRNDNDTNIVEEKSPHSKIKKGEDPSGNDGSTGGDPGGFSWSF